MLFSISGLSTKISSLSMITSGLSTKISGLSTITSGLSTKISSLSTITSGLSTKITHCSTPLRKSRSFGRISDPTSALPSQKSPISSGFFCRKYIYIVKKNNTQHLQHLKIFQHLIGLGVVGVG